MQTCITAQFVIEFIVPQLLPLPHHTLLSGAVVCTSSAKQESVYNYTYSNNIEMQ